MPGAVQSIERAAAVLRLLSGGTGRLGCVEVANSLGLAKGTAHGILRTLHDVGFVDQDPATGKYGLGSGLLELRSTHLDVNMLRSIALNWSDALSARAGATVRLGVLDAGTVLVAHHGFRPDDSAQVLEVGARRPAHACAMGKVLLAHDAAAAAVLRGAPLTAYTRRTRTSWRDLAVELADTRRIGWAGEAGELEAGAAGIAAPVRYPGGLTVAAIGIGGPMDELCDVHGVPRRALVGLVQDAARAISRELASG